VLRDEPTIAAGTYFLPGDPLIDEILIPAFRQATRVRGAFGWFSAGWIKDLSPGLAEFLKRDDTSTIQMVVAPELFETELDALVSANEQRDRAIEAFSKVIDQAGGLEASLLSRHAVDCLTWMYANGRLEIRIAVPRSGSNYHPKIWEFSDPEDSVTVLGSANATHRALSKAAEHMTVECSWNRTNSVDRTSSKIDDWWRGEDRAALIETVMLSEAIDRQLLTRAPSEKPTTTQFQDALADSLPTAQRIEQLADSRTFAIPKGLIWKSGDYRHQGEAVAAWEESGRSGILAMATGAGKTRTSLIAAQRLWQEHEGPLLIVISVPTNALVDQWREECVAFGLDPVIPMRHSGERRKAALSAVFDNLRFGGAREVGTFIVTNNMLKNPLFHESLMKCVRQIPNLELLLIGDEVHGLGTEGFLSDPPEFFQYRIGLSATPVRQYDEEGTARLVAFFGETVYEFGLDRAIGFCLVEYDYFLHVVHLTSEEVKLYRDLSARIGWALENGDDEGAKRLMIRRRAIIENAEEKPFVLKQILAGCSPKHLLVYVSAKDPRQMEAAQEVLDELRIDATRVTEKESSNPEKLRSILKSFSDGNIDALLAKKVLDEGVDIPATREAILLASSTVEREWIQRRGRVLRRFPEKELAVIHDVIALPPPESEIDELMISAVESECNRVRAFAKYARNAIQVIAEIEGILDGYKVD
jgi:superfamily II DNA or RNA helicase